MCHVNFDVDYCIALYDGSLATCFGHEITREFIVFLVMTWSRLIGISMVAAS